MVLLVLEGMVEVIVRQGAPDAPRSTLWFALPAVAALLVPLLTLRRFPFAAPAAYWLLAAAITFVDGRLLTFTTSIFVLGMVVAFLLGNVPDARRARVGLAVVLVGAAIVVDNVPGRPASQLVFIPILFGICWLAGFVVREHAEQTEAAQVRATQAERERDAATRVAVADERARIARELQSPTSSKSSACAIGSRRSCWPISRASWTPTLPSEWARSPGRRARPSPASARVRGRRRWDGHRAARRRR